MHDAVPLSLVGVPPGTLRAWLGQAQAALQAVMTGTKPVQVSYAEGNGQRSVSYTKADMAGLRAWIIELQTALNPSDRQFRRRAISFAYGPSRPGRPF